MKATDGTIQHVLTRAGGLAFGDRRLEQDMGNLVVGLDRARSSAAHPVDCLHRVHPKFDEEPRCDHPGAPETSLAVDDDVEPAPEAGPKRLTCLRPVALEGPGGNGDVGDREVKPVHVAEVNLVAQVLHLQRVKLVLLHEGDESRGAPVLNGIKIDAEVALPRAGPGEWLALARAEGDADAAMPRESSHRRDPEGVGEAGSGVQWNPFTYTAQPRRLGSAANLLLSTSASQPEDWSRRPNSKERWNKQGRRALCCSAAKTAPSSCCCPTSNRPLAAREWLYEAALLRNEGSVPMVKKQTLNLGSNRSLFVAQAGTGSDVVLVHGAMTTSHDWLESSVFRTLTRSHRVSVIDRPGHGLSRRRRFGTPREQADQIAEGLAQLGVSRATVAAHSFGALVALALAERHPALVAELVLVAPLAFPEPRLIEHSIFAPRSIPLFGPLFSRFAEFTQLDRPMVDLLHEVMFAPATVPAQWKDSYPYPLILNAQTMVAEAEDSSSMLPMSPAGTIDMRSIKVRTQVLTGTSDRVVEDERQAKTLARQLPHGSVTEVEGAGHMLHHSHPDLVVQAVRASLAFAD